MTRSPPSPRRPPAQLAADAAHGAEVPFEVVDSAARGATRPLYCYRPLTAEFIDERCRAPRRGCRPTCPPCTRSAPRRPERLPRVARRARRRATRASAPRPRCALFLARVFEDSTDFVLSRAALRARVRGARGGACAKAAPRPSSSRRCSGSRSSPPRCALGDGLALVRGDAFGDEAPADAVWAPTTASRTCSPCCAGRPPPATRRRCATPACGCAGCSPRCACTTTARVALGAARLDAHRRRAVAAVRARRAARRAARRRSSSRPAQEDELRAFCSLVARRTPRARRDGVGAAPLRARPASAPLAAEALTDHLLALRALLEPEGPAAAPARPPGRRCARAPGRAADALTERAVAPRARARSPARRSPALGAPGEAATCARCCATCSAAHLRAPAVAMCHRAVTSTALAPR